MLINRQKILDEILASRGGKKQADRIAGPASAAKPAPAPRSEANSRDFLTEKEFAMNAIKNFMRDEEGSVAIEYALLAALIGLAIVLGASFLGKQICGILNSIGTALAGATPAGGVTYTFKACA